jgi:protein-L-isoaspartate(D-aspartate) O-methyltransferase
MGISSVKKQASEKNRRPKSVAFAGPCLADVGPPRENKGRAWAHCGDFAMFLRLLLFRLVAVAVAATALAGQACSGPIMPPPQDRAAHRKEMVEQQIRDRDVRNERVLNVMAKVPRHEFVAAEFRDRAYGDHPLPIGHGQTISQPYIVAFMTEAIDPKPEQRVLEIGTGSGYQAAVLAELVKEVYTIELVGALAEESKTRLKRLGYKNIHVRAGDGYKGWPNAAPFDAVVVTCGADHVPEPLFEQLKPGGRMIIPVKSDDGDQVLRLITKGAKGERHMRDLLPVRFVPLRREGDPSKNGKPAEGPW